MLVAELTKCLRMRVVIRRLTLFFPGSSKRFLFKSFTNIQVYFLGS